LLANDNGQVSMRLFRASHLPDETGPIYCCQEDGMIGLGCGARSYTRHYHYSSDYAVGRRGFLDILREYIRRSPEAHDMMTYGFYLGEDDQRRCYLLKSLLYLPGLSQSQYQAYFGTDALADFPLLHELTADDLLTGEYDLLWLTAQGI
jgi:oxygen-independent coproporphyrinogen III oxidase